MLPKTIKPGVGAVMEATSIATAIAVPVVAFSWHVLGVPNPTSLQKTAFFILNFPSIVIWTGGGENDSSRILARLVIMAQWIAIGVAVGWLVALVRRLPRLLSRKSPCC
jgi:hypothetical protein